MEESYIEVTNTALLAVIMSRVVCLDLYACSHRRLLFCSHQICLNIGSVVSTSYL